MLLGGKDFSFQFARSDHTHSLSLLVLKNGSPYFKNLDSIRFLAAFMVLLSHIIRPAYDYVQMPEWLWRGLTTISYGGNGVSLFFVMSGFLITYLLIEERKTKGRIQLFNFYLRRTLRIWPLYFLVIAFAFGLYPLLKQVMGVHQELRTNVWFHLGFLANFDLINVQQNCFGSDAMSQNINWSISIEEQFYVFWPLIFAFLPPRTWLPVIFTLLCISLAFRIQHHENASLLYFHTLSVLPDLMMGGLAAISVQFSNKMRQFFENCGFAWQAFFLLLLFGLLLFRTELSTGGYWPAYSRFIFSFSMALVITSQALNVKKSVLNLSNWGFASRMGKYTYSIYLLHPLAILFVDISMRLLHLTTKGFWPIILGGTLAIVLTFVLSILSYRYFESPFLKLKERFTAG